MKARQAANRPRNSITPQQALGNSITPQQALGPATPFTSRLKQPPVPPINRPDLTPTTAWCPSHLHGMPAVSRINSAAHRPIVTCASFYTPSCMSC